MHYKFNTDVSITLTVQTVQHRNATVFTMLKELTVLTPFHTTRHFKPNESQTPIFTASPNLPWQLLKLWPVAETMKTSAHQFNPQWLCVNGSVQTQSLLFTLEPGRKGVFFLDQWTLLSRWKNLIGFLQNAANSYQECILRGVLLGTDLLLSQPYVIPSSRSDSSKRQKISVSHPSRWDYRTRRKSKFSAHLYNLSYNSSLTVQAHWDVKVTEILLLFLKWGIWTFMNGQLFAEWTSDLLRFTGLRKSFVSMLRHF